MIFIILVSEFWGILNICILIGFVDRYFGVRKMYFKIVYVSKVNGFINFDWLMIVYDNFM